MEVEMSYKKFIFFKINSISFFKVLMIVHQNLFLQKFLKEKELMDFLKWNLQQMWLIKIIYTAFILSFMSADLYKRSKNYSILNNY